MRLFPCLTFALALAVTPVLAETDDELRLRLATEHATQAAEDIDMEKMIRQMWKPVVDQARAIGKDISQEQQDKLNTLYQSTFTEPMMDLMKAQGPIMAKHLSLDEVKALRAFYATPEGRSVLTKFPDIFADQQPQIMQMVQSKMPALMPTIMEMMQ